MDPLFERVDRQKLRLGLIAIALMGSRKPFEIREEICFSLPPAAFQLTVVIVAVFSCI